MSGPPGTRRLASASECHELSELLTSPIHSFFEVARRSLWDGRPTGQVIPGKLRKRSGKQLPSRLCRRLFSPPRGCDTIIFRAIHVTGRKTTSILSWRQLARDPSARQAGRRLWFRVWTRKFLGRLDKSTNQPLAAQVSARQAGDKSPLILLQPYGLRYNLARSGAT